MIGPAAAAIPLLVTTLTLAAFHREAQGIGIAVAALLMAYVYGLIPAVLCGVLFACYIRRHPPATSSSATIARLGVVAGFFSSLPLAALTFLFTEKVLDYGHVLMAGTFLVISIFSGALCAVLWRKWTYAVTKHNPARKAMNSTPAS
jgi:hypothetical protein